MFLFYEDTKWSLGSGRERTWYLRGRGTPPLRFTRDRHWSERASDSITLKSATTRWATFYRLLSFPRREGEIVCVRARVQTCVRTYARLSSPRAAGSSSGLEEWRKPPTMKRDVTHGEVRTDSSNRTVAPLHSARSHALRMRTPSGPWISWLTCTYDTTCLLMVRAVSRTSKLRNSVLRAVMTSSAVVAPCKIEISLSRAGAPRFENTPA